MKGPKIENLRDPKWLGKKVVKCYCSGEESRWMKVLRQGMDLFFYISSIGYKGSACYDVQDYQADFDWHEWIEEEKKTKFPYKVGDKIRINWWKPDFYVELMVLDIKKREVIVKRFPGEIICDAADSKSAFYQDIVQSTAWELYVENELKFPFNVGDKIKPEWWNNEGKHLEILEINGPYFAQYQPKEARFEIVAKKSWHNGNTINRSVTYLITDKDFTKWSLWKNPDTLNDAPRLQLKKKKTVAFALTRNSNDSFYLSELAYTYDSEDSKIIKRSPNTIQFPAVTKDGTVLEFEVDDES